MVEHLGERTRIGVLEALEQCFGPGRPARLGVQSVAAPQQVRAHGRGDRERNQQREQDGDRQRHGEFVEQQADDARHQQDGYEHRDQRQAHRNHGETDFGAAAQRGFDRIHAGFEMADDVLQHHHRVVDDETGGDGERHQRQIVDAVAEQVHGPEGAEDGQRHHHRRYQRGARRLQEHEDHADDQQHGDEQAALGIAHRRGDRLRTVDARCAPGYWAARSPRPTAAPS